jgi:hypothetical protein
MNGEPDFMKLYRRLGDTRSFEEAKDRVTPEGLKKVKTDLYDTEKAKGILSRAKRVWDSGITKEDLQRSIEMTQTKFAEFAEVPGMPGLPLILSQEMLPPDFKLPLAMPPIDIDPNNLKFERDGDALGWVLFAGYYWIHSRSQDRPKAPFRRHSTERTFVYNLPEPPLDIALFSDFGTGLYTSLYIAQQIKEGRFPYAIHLGDVYYAGRKEEFETNLSKPLEGILEDTRFFTMNANHEMLSDGYAYFEYIDTKKGLHPNQEQEGSYFCLRSNTFQIIGIDSDYFEEGRYREEFLRKWLEDALNHGRANNKTNILLTANEPYKYGDKSYRSGIYGDLKPFIDGDMIDLWFWGNTHYCALFDRGDEMKFIGSCIGHGGFPYIKREEGKETPAPLLFLETEPRFPAWTKLHREFGNNGFCILRLMPDRNVKLMYIDWLKDIRCEASLSRSPDGRLAVINKNQDIVKHPRNEHRVT